MPDTPWSAFFFGFSLAQKMHTLRSRTAWRLNDGLACGVDGQVLIEYDNFLAHVQFKGI